MSETSQRTSLFKLLFSLEITPKRDNDRSAEIWRDNNRSAEIWRENNQSAEIWFGGFNGINKPEPIQTTIVESRL